MRQSCTEGNPGRDVTEGRASKWEVLQGRRMWRPGSSSCFPPAVTAVPLPTLENNELIPLELPCNFSGPKAEIMLKGSSQGHPRCSPTGQGMGPTANMFQSHGQEKLESKVPRNQISLIPKDPHPNPTATACLGMVSPSPLPGQG